MRLASLIILAGWAVVVAVGQQKATPKDGAVHGYTDTPVLPDQKWRVHDAERPRPRVVAPASGSQAPSDAVVLFNGKDLSSWVRCGRTGGGEPGWKVQNGYLEVTPKTGDLCTK